MSKLARYKKQPVVKLPVQKASAKTKLKGVLSDSDDDDDDDFQTPIFREPIFTDKKKTTPLKTKPLGTAPSRISKATTSRSSGHYSSNSSSSEYFQPVSPLKESKTSEEQLNGILFDHNDNSSVSIITDNVERKDTIKPVPIGIATLSSKGKACKIKLPVPKKKTEKTSTDIKNEEILQTDDPKLPTILDDDDESANIPNDTKPKAMCPFCWKHLTDKLAGTVHVKACAKNLPTNQIFDALQLQEKQIKEWEELGIAYPGFQGGAGGSTTTSTGRGNLRNRPPRARKKKVDPDLELAIALSESLHEEVERRKIQECIPPELQKQNMVSVLPPPQQVFAVNDKKQGAKVPSQTKTTSKRGRKGSVMELPLYKATEIEKNAEIEKRLNIVLDEDSEKKSERIEQNVRTIPDIKSLRLPQRLKSYTNIESPLWTISHSDDSEIHNLAIEAVLDCKKSKMKDPPEILVPESNHNLEPILNQGHNAKPDCFSPVFPAPVKTQDSTRQTNSLVSPLAVAQMTDQERFVSSFQSQLINDILRMFVNKDHADLVVYGREEKQIKCHKFIIKARCPKLYAEIVSETSAKGVKRQVISLTCFSHVAVKAFIKFLYCARPFKPELSEHVLEEIRELGKQYEIRLPDNSLEDKKTLSCNNSVQVESPLLTTVMVPTAIPIAENEKHPRSPCKSQCNLDGSIELFNDNVELFNDNVEIQNQPDSVHILPFQDVENVDTKSVDQDHSNIELAQDECRNVSIEGDDGSRDLFEDFDNDEDDAEKPDVNFHEISTKSDDPKPPPDDIDLQLDKELMSQFGTQYRTLLSPKPYSHNKRSRSKSPIRYSSSQSYTASQMAEYIDLMEDHSPTRSQNVVDVVENFNFTEEDAFAVGGDSCFLNLPSVLLQGDVKTPVASPVKLYNVQQNVLSPATRSSPNKSDSSEITNRSKKRGRKKRQRALSQESTPTFKNTETAKTVNQNVPTAPSKPTGPNGMNYSTVDTPILKKELKRFGLKPLPRSKAKLILRHIIEETNKNFN